MIGEAKEFFLSKSCIVENFISLYNFKEEKTNEKMVDEFGLHIFFIWMQQ